MLRDSYSIHKCNDRSYHKVATSKSRDLPFLVGFGHNGHLFEGLDFSDTELTHQNSKWCILRLMLSSGGTGAKLVPKLPSQCPS